MAPYTPAVLDRIRSLVREHQPAEIADAFDRCFLDTLDRTIELQGDGTAFVITGDIPAMWLRDSTTQLTPYLHFLGEDPALADTVAAVSRKQLQCVLLDPYANAFNNAPTGPGHQDVTEASDWVWERKYELDSLCYPIQLAHRLWAETGRVDHLQDFQAAAAAILDLLTTEQDHAMKSNYRFQRLDGPASDTLTDGGRGEAAARTGLSWSGFRPSDDACRLNYNIPGNAFAVVELGHLEQLAVAVWNNVALAERARAVRVEIADALVAHGVVQDPDAGRVFAYEVNGFGDVLLMDDANVPSLLSLPLLGYCDTSDPVYLATRELVLSARNPYYYRGSAAAGIGSPHTPAGAAWPIGLAVEALTSGSRSRQEAIAALLVHTDACTGLMHESFDVNDPTQYTRPWFSWANAMFCELVLELVDLRKPVPPI